LIHFFGAVVVLPSRPALRAAVAVSSGVAVASALLDAVAAFPHPQTLSCSIRRLLRRPSPLRAELPSAGLRAGTSVAPCAVADLRQNLRQPPPLRAGPRICAVAAPAGLRTLRRPSPLRAEPRICAVIATPPGLRTGRIFAGTCG
jgi:hypothetical protein